MGSRLLSSEQYSGEQSGMDGVDDVVGVTSRGGVMNPYVGVDGATRVAFVDLTFLLFIGLCIDTIY